jgi:hypothetical protein
VGYLRVKKTQSPLAVNGLKKIGPAVPALEVPSQEANAVTRNEVKPADTKAKDTIPAVTKQNEVTTKADNTTRGGGTAIEGSGYFKSVYLQQYKNQANLKVESGQAAIFKSTSGWQDAKYYALMSSVTPGTIIRISNPANSKAIFAKVLGELPPGKENEGLLVRISNAAAAELMVNEKETKFMAEVAYVKN